jgi:NADPH-dependent F420 reductase
MRIAVIGAGRVGAGLGRRFGERGHEIVVGSREPDRAAAIAAELGARPGPSYREAADAADVVIFSVPWWGVDDALSDLGPLEGQIVLDTTNPYTDDSYTVMVEFLHTSAAEQIQERKPAARVVKGWNTVHAQVIDSSPDFNGIPASVFICGDDAEAKAVVATLAKEIGYGPVDCGGLSSARFVEPMAGLKVRLSYDLGMGVEQAINLIER